MTTTTDTPGPRLAACVEIAERLTTELATSLRWLANHPGSGATLVIEAFVRDGELVLVADFPGSARPKRARKEPSARRPTFEASAHRGLLNFALPLTPEGRKSPLSAATPAARLISSAS